QSPKVELARVALDRGAREVRDVGVRHDRARLERAREVAEAGAEDDADLGRGRALRALAHERGRLLDAGFELTGHLRRLRHPSPPSAPSASASRASAASVLRPSTSITLLREAAPRASFTCERFTRSSSLTSPTTASFARPS